MNEQIFDAIFVHVDIDFDEEIEKRENFDAKTERETISIQNICFFDVAIDAINDCFDVTNEIIENKWSKIDFEWLTSVVNINVDSLDDVNVAKNVNFAIVILKNLAFDVKKSVDVDANIAIDVISINSHDVNVAISVFDVNIAISFANFVNFFWW